MELEQRIRRLEDRAAIIELTSTYCFLVDDGRFDELVDNWFAADAVCDFRSRTGGGQPMISEGREAVRRFFKEVVAGTLREMTHTTHNHRVVIEGDRASGDCYFELTARNTGTSEAMVGAGRYSDRYVRVSGRWRFLERNADIFYIVPLSRGW